MGTHCIIGQRTISFCKLQERLADLKENLYIPAFPVKLDDCSCNVRQNTLAYYFKFTILSRSFPKYIDKAAILWYNKYGISSTRSSTGANIYGYTNLSELAAKTVKGGLYAKDNLRIIRRCRRIPIGIRPT